MNSIDVLVEERRIERLNWNGGAGGGVGDGGASQDTELANAFNTGNGFFGDCDQFI